MTASFEGRSVVVTASLGQMDGFPILPVPCHLAGGINTGWNGTGQDRVGWDVVLLPPLPCFQPMPGRLSRGAIKHSKAVGLFGDAEKVGRGF